MGRYYDLKIYDPNNSMVWKMNASGGFTKSPGGTSFTSLMPNPRGGPPIDNPGALNIEFDIPTTTFDGFQGSAVIRIHGIGIGAIGQASNLNGQLFTLNAGMTPGLPLATAAYNANQSGLALAGSIQQAFGNWEGTEQTIDLICNPGDLVPANGIAFTWPQGTPLAAALFTTLSQAFPKYKAKVNILNGLQPPQGGTQYGCYKTLGRFAEYLQQMTKPLGAQVAGVNSYSGVQLTIIGQTVYAFDSETPGPLKTVDIAFQDLIGQPTWMSVSSISFKTVLRADIGVGNDITLPLGIIPAYALTTQGASLPNAPSRSKTAFQGTFRVTEKHYYANFRQADAYSWNTSYVAQINGPG